MRRFGAALAAVRLALPAAARETADDAAQDARTRPLRRQCMSASANAQAGVESDWKMIYDIILTHPGSSLAFIFATASGHGASLAKDRIDCAAPELGADPRRFRPRGGGRVMRRAACLLVGALGVLLVASPASAAMAPSSLPAPAGIAARTPAPGLTPGIAGLAAAESAPVMLARCGPRCRVNRRAIRRHHRRNHWRPYRPRPGDHSHRKRRRDAAAAAVIGGVVGLGVGAAIAHSNRPYHGHDEAPFDLFGQTR